VIFIVYIVILYLLYSQSTLPLSVLRMTKAAHNPLSGSVEEDSCIIEMSTRVCELIITHVELPEVDVCWMFKGCICPAPVYYAQPVQSVKMMESSRASTS
jgi:hypothetical protein